VRLANRSRMLNHTTIQLIADRRIALKSYFPDTHSVALSLQPSCYREWNEPLTEIPLISIVDDDDLTRAAVESLVRSLGFSACTFASAESFLRSSSVLKTRCLILDVQMPKMSGVDLQDYLSRNGTDIPIIFITAYSDEAVKARALNAGAVCFLQKPLDLQGPRLVDCLYAALRRPNGPVPPA
jgi:FixJ family two-component response regulator